MFCWKSTCQSACYLLFLIVCLHNYSMFLFVNGEILHCVCENVLSHPFPVCRSDAFPVLRSLAHVVIIIDLEMLVLVILVLPFPQSRGPLLCNTIQSCLWYKKAWPWVHDTPACVKTSVFRAVVKLKKIKWILFVYLNQFELGMVC